MFELPPSMSMDGVYFSCHRITPISAKVCNRIRPLKIHANYRQHTAI